MCDIRCWSYRQKHFGLGYSAPCRRIYVVFCVWGTCRCLDQRSKLHRPPLHGLACSTTFSRRKKNLTITIGLLAPLVLGNMSACIQVPSAPQAWPPNYKRVPSTAGTRKHVCLHMQAPRVWPPNEDCVWKTSCLLEGRKMIVGSSNFRCLNNINWEREYI